METKIEKIIYDGKTRQELIDAIVEIDVNNMESNTLADILEFGHTGYSSLDDQGLIEAYLHYFE